jgi:hypothetical protein
MYCEKTLVPLVHSCARGTLVRDWYAVRSHRRSSWQDQGRERSHGACTSTTRIYISELCTLRSVDNTVLTCTRMLPSWRQIKERESQLRRVYKRYTRLH